MESVTKLRNAIMKEQKMKKEKDKTISRRQFMGGAAAAMAFTVVPSNIFAQPPSEKLNVAAIGAGGMGAGNTRACAAAGANIVALCDVDWKKGQEGFRRFPEAKKYKDFRRMLDNEKSIDAVIVATPDHFHTVAAMAAMRRGKHVYVQKPLTRLVSEARALTEAARKYKVVTQMGNQGHSGNGVRNICEWIWDGAIGEIREVHAWTNRPVWPQGIDRPKGQDPVPDTLDWDLWIGPAPMRPYLEGVYNPFVWRGWWDFGGGALADMACHVLDPVFWALKLKYPTSVEASCTKVNNETFPLASVVHFEYPAREGMPPVKIHWYDGGLKPEKPEALGNMRLEQAASNVLFMGSKGVLRCGEYGDDPHLFPLSLMREYKRPQQTLERIKTSHEGNWLEACKTGGKATSNFDYAGPLTEMVVMGNLAIRPENVGKKLEWDGENMRVTNDEKANDYVQMHYRDGWSLEM
jgi:predicted dehydrogenase